MWAEINVWIEIHVCMGLNLCNMEGPSWFSRTITKYLSMSTKMINDQMKIQLKIDVNVNSLSRWTYGMDKINSNLIASFNLQQIYRRVWRLS